MRVFQLEQQFCQTDWGRVCYWMISSFPAVSQPLVSPTKTKLVLFLHGVGGSGRYWFSYLEELSQNAGPVIALAPDLLGFGASDKPEIDYTTEVHLKVIEAVVNDYLSRQQSAEIGPIELDLVGHSMGGILAVLLAARLVSSETKLLPGFPHLSKLVLLATPYASPKHDLNREVLRSPMNRAMLSHPLICETVHHSMKLLWPLILFLVRKRVIKLGLPLPIITDYMQHTCRSYTSSAHHVIFETNLEPALELLQAKSSKSLQTLLVYSHSDMEVLWRHGQELTAWFKGGNLEFLEQVNHQAVGQAALKKVIAFLL